MLRHEYVPRRVGQGANFFVIAALAVASSGCAHQGPFVWVDDLPEAEVATSTHVIRPGDRVAIRVWNQPKLSVDVRVRADGRAMLPLIGDTMMAGQAIPECAAKIAERLERLVVDPIVTVNVVQESPSSVSVLGEVQRAGNYPLDADDGVLRVIAKAGGFTDFASRDHIYVLRKEPKPKRIRFTYADLASGNGRANAFELRDRDLLLIE